MVTSIDIKDLDKAELLRRLHANTRARGMGALHDRGSLTYEEAQAILNAHHRTASTPEGKASFDIHRFDYVRGRPVKVTFLGDELRGAAVYDRDCGPGECARVVEAMRAELKRQ